MTPEYKTRRALKHKAQSDAKAKKFLNVNPEIFEQGTPVLKPVVQARQWQALKQKPTQTGNWKNMPGKFSSTVVERSSDYFKGLNSVPSPVS
jgi:hypothetical protein